MVRLIILALLLVALCCLGQMSRTDPGVDPAYLANFLPSSGGITNLTRGLMVWLKLDEGSGTTAADSTDSCPGGIQNFHAPGWVTGKIGPYAIDFDQFNAPLYNRLDVTNLTTQADSGAITWWMQQFQPYNIGAVRPMWGWFANGTTEFDCQVFSNNNWYIGRGNTPELRITFAANATNMPQNVWMHYAFVWGTTGQQFYTNGVLCASNLFNSGTNKVAGDFFHLNTLGNNLVTATVAYYDDVRYYTNDLTAAEISYLYHQWYAQP